MISLLLFLSLFASTIADAYVHRNGTREHMSIFKESFIPDNVQENIDILVNNYEMLIFIWFAGNVIAMTFISQILYGGTNAIDSDEETSQSEDSGSDKDSAGLDLDELNKEDITYESQYFDKLEEIPDKELTVEELKIISGKRLIEETPKGVVIMFYNNDTGTFDYYTDKFADISYEILDTVARLFAITFECKQVCVNYRNEIQNGENRMLSEIDFDKMQKEKAKAVDNNKERSVFATFKSYNKKNGNNSDKKYYIITEKANRFKYKGKVSDYENTLSKTVSENDTIKISYSEYKQMLKNKELDINVQEPAAQEPAAQEPAAQEPTVQEPTAQEPTAQEPAVQEPTVQEPAVQDPTSPEPVDIKQHTDNL